MGKWLYNGLDLTKAPTWDESVHPFAWIGRNAVSTTKKHGLYLYVSAEQPVVMRSEISDHDVCSATTVLMCPYDEDTETWGYSEESIWHGPLDNSSPYAPCWSNFDVMRSDGSFYLAASEPIPEKPLDRPEFKWGLSVGMSIKGRSGSKDGSTYIIVAEDGTAFAATEVNETIAFTATPADVLRGKVAASAEGVIVGTYAPTLQEITITPGTEEQYFTPGEGYDGIGSVTVEATEVVVSDEDTLRMLVARTFTTFNFPDGVTAIGIGAFYGCSTLNLTGLPDSIAKISDYAFGYCTALTFAELPDGITSIGVGAFYNCNALPLIALPDALVTLGDYAFDGCSSLVLSDLPAGLTSISHYAFAGCEKITLEALPDGVTKIGNYAFSCCSALTLSALPDALESIGVGAFESCPDLAVTAIPAAVKTIENYAFSNCTGLTTLTFKGTPTSIAENAFANCANLVTINVPWAQGAVANAPWGATNATIAYNYVEPETEG